MCFSEAGESISLEEYVYFFGQKRHARRWEKPTLGPEMIAIPIRPKIYTRSFFETPQNLNYQIQEFLRLKSSIISNVVCTY